MIQTNLTKLIPYEAKKEFALEQVICGNMDMEVASILLKTTKEEIEKMVLRKKFEKWLSRRGFIEFLKTLEEKGEMTT